jgi:dTDP-4-dehydrorhamnose 3,5-epimerase-like enzyme
LLQSGLAERTQDFDFELFRGQAYRAMEIIKTSIPEVIVIQPKIQGDSRGFFMELFQSNRYAAAGIGGVFVHDNLSRSTAGVLRACISRTQGLKES